MVPHIRSLAAPLALALTMGACADPGLRGTTTASPSARAQPASEAPLTSEAPPPSPATVGAERIVGERTVAEKALAWHELTERARDHERRGELVEAQERLAQAAAQVASRPPHHATRRAVFGMQARLAVELARQGEVERADELAQRLLAVAETEPTIGGSALISLARSVVARRAREPEPIPVEDKLRILGIALATAEAGRIDGERLRLAFDVAREGLLADELALARRAIELAARDARTLHPGDRRLRASIELQRARIALEQDALADAEAAATRARDLFAEITGLPSEQGMSEVTLARALARRGDSEAARALAREAESRLESEADAEGALTPHARRVILAGSGRVELATGHPEAARRRLREALEIPALDLAADRHLIERIQRDLDSMPAREKTALGTGNAPD